VESIHWPDLEERRVLLGVSGGIAAYKAAELCRLLARCGASVQVMMTEAARRFVGEITFAALSDHPVATDLFDPVQEAQIGHIGLADSAELLVLAPATADLMAKLACGMADDLVTTVCLAYTGPQLLAPAMNVHMWEHPATRHNLSLLRERGWRVVGPGSGEMACGHVGEGRMAEPEAILEAAGACLAPQDLAGRTVVITAGPTHEPLDPARFLGNRSSGKMGFALAAEAASRGARVTLVSGPGSLATPHGVERVAVVTAAEMARVVRDRAAGADAVIMAAAVADYRPAQAASTKLKKETLGRQFMLTLERTEDILAGLGALAAPRPFLVGFAAETAADAELECVAREKLAAKRCDLLVANNVGEEGAGFGVDTNRVTLFDGSDAAEALPLMSKRKVAQRIMDRVAAALERDRHGR
jgi:phosphopantothenoylcysteine decarboxylase/phosphopantothenate--cysteine ligase